MRDLKFWTDRFVKVAREVWGLSCRVREFEYSARLDPRRKLKKMYGHALNRDYSGFKIHRRRKRWLFERVVILTKAGTARREMKRLETTKLAFYAKKITELGGVVPDRWS